jgi:hypothetical protein
MINDQRVPNRHKVAGVTRAGGDVGGNPGRHAQAGYQRAQIGVHIPGGQKHRDQVINENEDFVARDIIRQPDHPDDADAQSRHLSF